MLAIENIILSKQRALGYLYKNTKTCRQQIFLQALPNQGCCNSNPAVTNYWLNVLLGPFPAFIFQHPSCSFFVREDGTDLMHWVRDYLSFHMLDLVSRCMLSCQILSRASEGHMFLQHKVWQPVKRRTCDLGLSKVQHGCTGHWEDVLNVRETHLEVHIKMLFEEKK